MKKTADGYIVPDRIWYYLLEWNDKDKFDTLIGVYGAMKLGELTRDRLLNLFYVACQADIDDRGKWEKAK